MHQELCLYLSIVCCSRAPATAAVFSCCSWCCWSCPVQLFLLAKSCGVRLFQWFHRYYYRCLILDTFAPCIHICICTRNQAHTHLHWCERLLFVGFFFRFCSSISVLAHQWCFFALVLCESIVVFFTFICFMCSFWQSFFSPQFSFERAVIFVPKRKTRIAVRCENWCLYVIVAFTRNCYRAFSE